VKPPKFSYVRVGSLDEALQLLAEHGTDASVLAGGQSLMPTLNMRLARPSLLIDINRLHALKGISVRDDAVRIGALTRHVEVLNSPIVAQHLPLIAEAIPHVAHVAVRNRGTFGGSVALADPAAEMPACVLTLGATLVVESARGRRTIAADDYFKGLYETAREPDELLVEVLIPINKPKYVSAFMEISRRHGDFAIAGIACHALIESKVVSDMRLVCFGSEDKPTLARHAAAAIAGQAWSAATADAACAALARDLDPMANTFGRPATKLYWQQVLTRRALATAVERAGLP
jgi:carbon-monoxide dehydrogenase medium subunit